MRNYFSIILSANHLMKKSLLGLKNIFEKVWLDFELRSQNPFSKSSNKFLFQLSKR